MVLIRFRLPVTGASLRRTLAAARQGLWRRFQPLYHSVARSAAAGALALLVVSTPAALAAEAGVAVPETNPYRDPSQCVYLAWDLAAEAGHRLPKFGNAHAWRQGAIDHGYRVLDTLTPEAVNSVAVWDRYVGGVSWAGHVGWVTAVDGDEFYVKDRNWTRGADSGHWVQWVEGISFITFPDEAPAELQAAELAGAPVPVPEAAVRARPQGPTLAEMAHQEHWSRALNGELVDLGRSDRASLGSGAVSLPRPLRDLYALDEAIAGPVL